ncbi:uncharacterized protein LOC127006182 isoform X2 [Eriocheir sinensis]|uniref:uncharacterized protein LOC127006182 isoform X2 n=1 Tax=Eriocheir sinensis TaxID=95602 RepID=UPI0021C8F687|nr:uncharacterized protein LOC127006182 isoform X2 [Eriocheir sinensis]
MRWVKKNNTSRHRVQEHATRTICLEGPTQKQLSDSAPCYRIGYSGKTLQSAGHRPALTSRMLISSARLGQSKLPISGCPCQQDKKNNKKKNSSGIPPYQLLHCRLVLSSEGRHCCLQLHHLRFESLLARKIWTMIRSAASRAWRAWAAASTKANITTTTTGTSTIGINVDRRERLADSEKSTSSRSAVDEGLKWRFPADDRTQAMVAAVESGYCMHTIFTFNSKAPITPDLMEEALVHLYGKIESLRLCFRQRDGQLWVTDMPRQKLDFQVVNYTDLEHEHSEQHKVKFDLYNGPLWNARLMPCPPDAPCPLPEVKAAYPHQCHLLMSVHHAANDGMVVLLMSELLSQIIDSLLEGSPVDTRPVGELRDGVEAREEENRIREELEKDPERLMSAIRKHLASKHLPLLMEAYGVPNEANPTTTYLKTLLLDKQTVEKITAKARATGTTLNACFTAALNVSMMEVAREGGLEKDVYSISTWVPVDSRRLMKSCKNLPLGFHAIPFTQCTSTPRDVKKNFWQYVQHLDTELRGKVKRNYMCEQRVLEALLRPEGFTHEVKFSGLHIPDCDYLFSNLYSPNTTHQRGVGKNVQITAAGNYMSFHTGNTGVGQGVFPFRDQPRFQFAYSTGVLNRRVGERLLAKNVSVLHDVSNMVE